jgi:hypothetical protein
MWNPAMRAMVGRFVFIFAELAIITFLAAILQALAALEAEGGSPTKHQKSGMLHTSQSDSHRMSFRLISYLFT